MMHRQIENEEIIERYARNQLAPEERQAFEEHFLACDECFEELQVTERFIAGVHDAGRRSMLAGDVQGRAPAWRLGTRLIPAFGISASAALVLAVLTGWLYFFQMPRMHEQLSRSAAELREQQEARATLEQGLSRNLEAEGNVPLVVLQATRDVQASPNEVALPSEAERLVLWVEVPAGGFRSYLLQVDTADSRPIKRLENLKRNSYGALAVSLPVQVLPPGEYRIKLTGQEPSPASLLGEYRLRIRRP